MTAVFFNLLANSCLSLLAGLLVVHFFLWLFRIGTGPWKLFLLSLPFAKIVFDGIQGVPRDSILRSSLDTFALPPRHHYFRAGIGFSQWGPSLGLQFSAKDLTGKEYAESLGDYLVLWLSKAYGHGIPLAILSAAMAVSASLLALRATQIFRFERDRRRDRKLALTLRPSPPGRRPVDIYVSRRFSGSPFTGGILRPYICVPADAHRALSDEELEAVLAHELRHVRQLDLLGTLAVQALGDLFWFVPGYRWLSHKIDRLRELVADQGAVRAGIEPSLLASALLKLREMPAAEKTVLYSAFFREESLLKLRVERLLGEAPEPAPRFGWQKKWVRLAVAFLVCSSVMNSTLGGNHRTDSLRTLPWVERLFHRWGLEVP